MVPNMYHDSLMANVLSEELDKMNEDEESSTYDFDCGKFLKE